MIYIRITHPNLLVRFRSVQPLRKTNQTKRNQTMAIQNESFFPDINKYGPTRYLQNHLYTKFHYEMSSTVYFKNIKLGITQSVDEETWCNLPTTTHTKK